MAATSLGSSCTTDDADEGVTGYVDGPLDGLGGSSSAGGSGGAGGSSGGAAVTQGERYTPDPVAFGQIPGLSYSFADAAGVSDGEGPGRVWFHDSYCATFRPDGTGAMDRAGGRDQTLFDFPWATVEWAPGTFYSVAAPGARAEPAGTRIMDPEYDRSSEIRRFHWGVRVNGDGSIYENFSGNYEFRLVYDDDDSTSTYEWEPGDTRPYNFGLDFGGLSTDLPETNHFCMFRETRSTSLADDHARCIETAENYTGGLSFTQSKCYAKGFLDGEYSMVDALGAEIESGAFSKNRPTGNWIINSLEGEPRARGAFDEFGMHAGRWELHGFSGLEAKASFKGGLVPSGRGSYYRMLDGPFEKYLVGTDGPYLAESGSFFDGKEGGPWRLYDPDGSIQSERMYEQGTQIPNGQACFRLETGSNDCVPLTRSFLASQIAFDWGDCVNGSYVWTHVTYDEEGSVVTRACYELTGTPLEPVRGAERGCGSACQQ